MNGSLKRTNYEIKNLNLVMNFMLRNKKGNN
jgi:hypothetical protein